MLTSELSNNESLRTETRNGNENCSNIRNKATAFFYIPLSSAFCYPFLYSCPSRTPPRVQWEAEPPTRSSLPAISGPGGNGRTGHESPTYLALDTQKPSKKECGDRAGQPERLPGVQCVLLLQRSCCVARNHKEKYLVVSKFLGRSAMCDSHVFPASHSLK